MTPTRDVQPAEARLSGESPCVFTAGADGWMVCGVHGWSGPKSQRSRVVVCPDANTYSGAEELEGYWEKAYWRVVPMLHKIIAARSDGGVELLHPDDRHDHRFTCIRCGIEQAP